MNVTNRVKEQSNLQLLYVQFMSIFLYAIKLDSLIMKDNFISI